MAVLIPEDTQKSDPDGSCNESPTLVYSDYLQSVLASLEGKDRNKDRVLECRKLKLDGHMVSDTQFQMDDSDLTVSVWRQGENFPGDMEPYLRMELECFLIGLTEDGELCVWAQSSNSIRDNSHIDRPLEMYLGQNPFTFCGTVLASSRLGYVLDDGEDCLMVYCGDRYNDGYNIGENVIATGELKTFDYGMELYVMYYGSECMSGPSFDLCDPKVIGPGDVDAYVALTENYDRETDYRIPTEYILVEGRLEINEKTHNVIVDGNTHEVNIYNPGDRMIADAASMNGRKVRLRGYSFKLTSGQYLGVVPTYLSLSIDNFVDSHDAADADAKYQVEGFVTEVVDADSGVLYISDGSASIKVSELYLDKGDFVILKGKPHVNEDGGAEILDHELIYFQRF